MKGMSMPKPALKFFVCVDGKKCPERGGKKVLKEMTSQVETKGLDSVVTVKGTGCLKCCKYGPTVIAMPGKTAYGAMEVSNCSQVIDAHVKGEVVENLLVDKLKKERKKKKKKKK